MLPLRLLLIAPIIFAAAPISRNRGWLANPTLAHDIIALLFCHSPSLQSHSTYLSILALPEEQDGNLHTYKMTTFMSPTFPEKYKLAIQTRLIRCISLHDLATSRGYYACSLSARHWLVIKTPACSLRAFAGIGSSSSAMLVRSVWGS